MEYNLRTAVVEMKKQEEPGINYIYAKTYNYVYLRAKNILRRESDVQQLMHDVYVKMIEDSAEIEVENLYEWLGITAYKLGCGYYRKKKAREADVLEMEFDDFARRKIEYPEATSDIIAKSLEELPDLYQATFYAFYYDYMSIEKIADLMDCTEGVILNRLNYTRKYMIKALENCREEKKLKVFYSIEAVCIALRKWSVDHCLGMTAAQAVYAEICKSTKVQPAPIYLEGKEFAGVNNTVVYHKVDDYKFLEEQEAEYGKTSGPDKKVIGILVGLVAVVAVVILAIGLSTGSDGNKKADPKEHVNVEQQKEETTEKKKEDKKTTEDVKEEKTEEAKKDKDKDKTNKEDDSEYIFADSDSRELTRAELEGLSKEQLRLARNEIFARHGMIFGVEDLDTYFGQKSWYKGTVPSGEFLDTVEMSLIEEANVSLILEVEGTK